MMPRFSGWYTVHHYPDFPQKKEAENTLEKIDIALAEKTPFKHLPYHSHESNFDTFELIVPDEMDGVIKPIIHWDTTWAIINRPQLTRPFIIKHNIIPPVSYLMERLMMQTVEDNQDECRDKLYESRSLEQFHLGLQRFISAWFNHLEQLPNSETLRLRNIFLQPKKPF
jgi:hypothetical protein